MSGIRAARNVLPIPVARHSAVKQTNHDQVPERIERLAVERASSAVIASAAREEGMQTLRQDGLAKVLAGVTSLDEVLRVVA